MKNAFFDHVSRYRNVMFGIGAAALAVAFIIIRFVETDGCVASGILILAGAVAGTLGYLAEAVVEDPSMMDGPFGSMSPDDDETLWRHRAEGRRRY